jgi:imidazolonepropionase-like amidohydrolase
MGVGASSAVHAATGAPADAIGLGAEIGTLRPGRLADLVVLDEDPATDPSAFARVREVHRAGRLVAHRGRLVVEPLVRPPPAG